MIDNGPESRSRYEVITTLGQGGMARVLLTVTRGPAGVDKLLVVKELKAELKGDPEFLTMFLDEARIAARLNHPNVIQTFEVVSDGEHPLIVMEYLEGQSLSSLLGRVSRKSFPLDLHLHILSHVAAGLHYAHELRSLDGTLLDVVHRDVSPHNVFVTYDGLVKLVDFGIAKAADSAGLTRAGQFKGKIGYASPEQLGGGKGQVDRRTDVFALGVMLWESIARRRLTFGEAEGAVMNRRLHGNDPKLKDAAPDAPDELVAICERAMAFDPDQRFATAAELRAELDRWLDTSRRITAEDVGALVRDAFAEDRKKIRGIIEARIKELAADGSPVSDFNPFSRRSISTTQSSQRSAPSISGVLNTTPTGRTPASPTSGGGTTEPSEGTMKAATAASSPGGSERRFGPILIGVGVAVGIAVAALQLTRGGSASTPPEASATASAAAPPAAAATVDVSISADPPEARITLDDMALTGNPFHAAMPKSTLARHLRVSAPGYAPEERLVTLDRDLLLELHLKRASGEPSPSSNAAGPATPPPPRGPAATPPAAGPVKPPPPATAGPGEALTNPTRKTPRTIDTSF